jgi:serine/threonine protein kinase
MLYEDFGMAQHIEKSGGRGVRGTLMYMAPEILSLQAYDSRVDLWSIGVILYGRYRCVQHDLDADRFWTD